MSEGVSFPLKLKDVVWLDLEFGSMLYQGRLGGEVEALTSHYVASMAASKLFAFLFWYFSYNELSPRTGGRNLAGEIWCSQWCKRCGNKSNFLFGSTGWAVIFSYSAQTLLFVDFF